MRKIRILGFATLALSAALVMPSAIAQNYKCVVGGKSVYSEAPCAPNARSVDAMQDRLSREQQLDRQRVVSRERRQLSGIEAEAEADRRQHARMAEQVAASDRAAAGVKASRCNSAQRDVQSAKRSVAIFQDVGLQNSLNQRKAEQDAAERRVRDECN